MNQEKFKPDKKRHVNLSKQEKNLQAYFLNATGENGKNTLSKSGEIKMWIFGIGAIVVFIGLFALAFNIVK